MIRYLSGFVAHIFIERPKTEAIAGIGKYAGIKPVPSWQPVTDSLTTCKTRTLKEGGVVAATLIVTA